MASKNVIKAVVGIDGEKEYSAAVKGINDSLNTLGSQMKLVTAEFGNNATSAEALRAKQEILEKTLDGQNAKMAEAAKLLEAAKNSSGATAEQINALEREFNTAATAVAKASNELDKNTASLQAAESPLNGYKDASAKIDDTLKTLGTQLTAVTAQYANNATSAEALRAKQSVLNDMFGEQKSKVENAEQALAAAKAQYGENSSEVGKYEQALNTANSEMLKTQNELSKLQDEAEKSGVKLKETGNEAKESGEKASKSAENWGKLGAALGGALAALGAAAAGAATALAKFTVDGAQFADDLLTQSTYTRQSTDDLQKYAYACRFIDTDMEKLTGSMTKNIKSMASYQDGWRNLTDKVGDTKAALAEAEEAFNKNGIKKNREELEKAKTAYAEAVAALGTFQNSADNASNAYGKLGVAVVDADGHLRDSNDVYWEAIDALGKIENETERDALAMQVFGKSGTELNSIIEAGSEAFKALGDEAVAMGAVMSGDSLNALGAFDDKMQQLDAGLGGLKNSAAMIALPFLDKLSGSGVNIMQDFGKAINDANGDMGKMADAVGGALSSAVGLIAEQLPQFIEMGMTMIQGLIAGLVENLPAIAESALQIVMTLVEALTSPDFLPKLVEGAAQLLVTLATGIGESLPTLIPAIIDVALMIVQTLIDNMPLLVEGALKLVTGLAQGIIDAIPVIVEKLPELITGLVNGLLDSIEQIVQAGITLLVALVDALPEIIDTIVAVLPEIIEGIIDALMDHLDDIINAGIDLFIALVENLPKIITTLVEAIPKIISGLVEKFTSEETKEKLKEAGIKLFTSIKDKIGEAITKIKEAIPKIIDGIVNSLKENWDRMKEAGKQLLEGLWEGLTGAAEWLWNQVKGLLNGLTDKIKKFFGISSPSTLFRDQIGAQLALGMAAGIEAKSDKAKAAADKMSKETFAAAKTWITQYQQETDYIASEELAMWKSMRDAYEKNSKERVEIEKNINKLTARVQADALKEQQQALKDSFDFSKQWIADKKEMNELSAADEIAAWERVAARYDVGTAQRIEADKNLLKAREDFAKQQETIISNMEAVEKKYTDALESRTQTIAGAYGIFDEVTAAGGEVSGQTLLTNLQDQVDAVSRWSFELQTLAKRGISDGLLTELEKMGVKSTEEIAALNRMTDEDLTQYSGLWESKMAFARKQATFELQGLREDTKKELDGLADDLRAMGSTEIMVVLADGMRVRVEEVVDATNESVTAMGNALEARKTQFSDWGGGVIKNLADGLAKAIPAATEKIPQLTDALARAINSTRNQFENAGDNMVRGIWDGFAAMSGWLESRVRDMMSRITNAVRDEMDIHSPSRVFAGIGEFMAEGLGDGFTSEMRAVERQIRAAMPRAANYTADAQSGSSGAVSQSGSAIKSAAAINITQNIYAENTDYAKQQREAAWQFKQIARAIA